jgi:hypothetical protein
MTDWSTWSPFQSPQTKEICAHLTTKERRTLIGRSALVGLAMGFVSQGPVFLYMAGFVPTWLMIVLIGGFFVVLLSLTPLINAWSRRFLCNTEWARAQGLQPHELVLFDVRFGIKHLLALMFVVAIASALIWHLRPK